MTKKLTSELESQSNFASRKKNLKLNFEETEIFCDIPFKQGDTENATFVETLHYTH
jgi:hypothetical protein